MRCVLSEIPGSAGLQACSRGAAILALVACLLGGSTPTHAQAPLASTTPKAPAAATATANPTAPPSKVASDYIIGPEDVLTVFFWHEKDLSGDVVVRPDGRISLPLLNDVQAAGVTPEQLRQKLTEAATKYVQDPNVTVIVKTINSKKVFITGQVSKPGAYQLGDNMTAIQLIAMAGGLLEFADKDNIVVMRAEKRPDGQPWSFRLNYSEVMRRVNPKQNIDLKPGDTVLVP